MGAYIKHKIHNFLIPIYTFLRTTGDGNCLFNSCSLALIGDETISATLRFLACIEIYLNADYYSAHPTILSAHEEGAFLIS